MNTALITPMTGFVTFLLLTVVLLLATAWTGKRAMRGIHLPLVACTVAGLATAIYYALALGPLYDLDGAGWIYPVHITLARVATASYLAPLLSGIATIRNGRHRALHGKIAGVVILLTVLAAITGVWMILVAEKVAS